MTNRVAGFICKSVLSGHTGCVTCMVVVGREQGYDSTYLVSVNTVSLSSLGTLAV